MDSTERHVFNHLQTRNFSSIEYEPDGNIPPDFLVDGKVAIEVRRLNQHHFSQNNIKGLEEVAIPLWQRVTNLIEHFSPPIDEESWFVNFTFSRPVPKWKKLEPLLQSALEQFCNSPIKTPTVLIQTLGIHLEVFHKASKKHSTMFLMGAYIDKQSGGLVLSEMEKNITHCSDEKSLKIANFKSNYYEWWLILVDHIGYGLDELNISQFNEYVTIKHSWDKIIIIDPLNENIWFEIENKK